MNPRDADRSECRAEACAPRMQVRKARVSDAPAFARIMSDPAVYAQLLQMPHADEELWRHRLAETCAPGKDNLLLVAEIDGELIGAAGLHSTGLSPRRRHAMGLGIQVRADWQGRGAGALLMQSLCDYADRWLGLLRLELTVFVDNHGAQGLYRRFGFVDEGVLRAYALRDGVYTDALSMARLNPRPWQGLAPA